MKKGFYLALVPALFLVGCASNPAVRVSDAKNIQSVSAIGMTCSQPFEIMRDCSNWSGPNKKITLGDKPLRIGGNLSSTVTVVFADSVTDVTQITNLGYELMKRELVSRGFNIVKVTPIESGGLMFGYAIETEKPNYDIWDEFAADKKNEGT